MQGNVTLTTFELLKKCIEYKEEPNKEKFKEIYLALNVFIYLHVMREGKSYIKKEDAEDIVVKTFIELAEMLKSDKADKILNTDIYCNIITISNYELYTYIKNKELKHDIVANNKYVDRLSDKAEELLELKISANLSSRELKKILGVDDNEFKELCKEIETQ